MDEERVIRVEGNYLITPFFILIDLCNWQHQSPFFVQLNLSKEDGGGDLP